MSACPRCGSLMQGDACAACLAAMAEHPSGPPLDENPLEPGEMFRGVRITGLIARGGMGIVYKAKGADAFRAVKILPRSLAAQAEFRERFEREAGALAALGHPNIVGLHDFGIENGLPFLIMDFVDGRSLRQALRRGRFPLEEAARVAREVCDALEAAHQQGIVHRDVKPDNVLLDPAGRVKVTDFGLAKLMGLEHTRLTESNIVIGTPHYMAPEQLERPTDVDRRADVYSFGVLLYEMLTGALPIGRFALPSEKGAGNPQLDALVLRCLEADPAKRFPDASSLKLALLKATGLPAPADAPGRKKFTRNAPLTCGACGWTFFVPTTERGFVNCPSCRAPVSAIAVRAGAPAAPPPPTPVAKVAPPPRKGLPAAVYAVAAALVLGFLAAAVAVIRGSSKPSVVIVENHVPSTPESERPKPIRPAPERPVAPPTPVAPVEEVDGPARAERLSRQCNMAGLVGAILLLDGRLADHAQIEERLAVYDAEIRRLDRRRAEEFPYMHKGDRLVGVDAARLDRMTAAAFAEELRSWLRNFKAGRQSSFHVLRETSPVLIPVEFPERTKDLNALAQFVDVMLGEGLKGEAPAPPPGPSPFPADLLAEIERKLAALAPYHRERTLGADANRPRLLLNAASGTPEDAEYLRQRVLTELLPLGPAEMEEFRARVAELEPKLTKPAEAPPDVVIFKDGRRLEGFVEAVDAQKVRVKGKIGSIVVDKADILRIEKGKPAGDDFGTRWAAAKGRKPELEALLRSGSKESKPLVAAALLLMDPGHETARLAAGYAKEPGGAWVRAEPTAAANGTIEWHGRTYTPEELTRELSSLGYVNLNGIWQSRVAASFKVDNLYRDSGKLLLRGGSVMSQMKNESNMVYDVRSRSWVPVPKAVSTGRFLRGSVYIEISAPGDIIDCRVRARGQVAEVGAQLRAAVTLTTSDPSPKPLYVISGPGESWPSVDVTDKVRGSQRFYIHASVSEGALFLPSDSNDLGVLEVKYTYGEPLKRINELLGARPTTPGLPTPFEVPGPPDDAKIEIAVRRMAEVYAESRILTEVLRDMRTSAERLSYGKDVEMPPRFSPLASLIEDPLRPKLETRSREDLLRVGEWWGSLPVDERRAFAYLYGLWCARWRALGK